MLCGCTVPILSTACRCSCVSRRSNFRARRRSGFASRKRILTPQFTISNHHLALTRDRPVAVALDLHRRSAFRPRIIKLLKVIQAWMSRNAPVDSGSRPVIRMSAVSASSSGAQPQMGCPALELWHTRGCDRCAPRFMHHVLWDRNNSTARAYQHLGVSFGSPMNRFHGRSLHSAG
jgi:hypothetical protein